MEERNFEETMNSFENEAVKEGLKVKTIDNKIGSRNVDTVVGAAIGSGLMLAAGVITCKVVVPIGRKGVKAVGDAIHNWRFPKPASVDVEAKDVTDEKKEVTDEKKDDDKPEK